MAQDAEPQDAGRKRKWVPVNDDTLLKYARKQQHWSDEMLQDLKRFEVEEREQRQKKNQKRGHYR